MKKIEINNCSFEEDIPYKIENGYMIIPERYRLLYFDDILEDQNISQTMNNKYKITEDEYIINDKNEKSEINITKLLSLQSQQFSLNIWYPPLENHKTNLTIHSIIIDINEEEEDILLNRNIPSTLLNKFKKELSNSQIKDWFIKLNSVSPKDNDHLLTESKNKFNLDNIKDFFDLINGSNRIYQALLEYRTKNSFCMRKYIKEIDISNEYRCFIYKGVLTAISQYDCYTHYEKIEKNQKEIRNKIKEFYKLAYEYIPYEDCVMDVVIDIYDEETFKNLNILIIEFNEFDSFMNVGSACFNWYLDRNILYGNDSFFEKTFFKFVEKDLFDY
jgi:hypothetical protein